MKMSTITIYIFYKREREREREMKVYIEFRIQYDKKARERAEWKLKYHDHVHENGADAVLEYRIFELLYSIVCLISFRERSQRMGKFISSLPHTPSEAIKCYLHKRSI
jgi:hypothetical protein